MGAYLRGAYLLISLNVNFGMGLSAGGGRICGILRYSFLCLIHHCLM